jgi:hypothetical protein
MADAWDSLNLTWPWGKRKQQTLFNKESTYKRRYMEGLLISRDWITTINKECNFGGSFQFPPAI